MDLKTAINQFDLSQIQFFGAPNFKEEIRVYSSFNDSDYFLQVKNTCENPICLKVFTDKSPFGSNWGGISISFYYFLISFKIIVFSIIRIPQQVVIMHILSIYQLQTV